MNKVNRFLFKNAVVVSKHRGMIEFLKSEGFIDNTATVLERAKAEDVRGKIVFGSIPLFLAYYAQKVIHIPLKLPLELKEKELTAEEFKKYALKPAIYEVKRTVIGDNKK